MVGSCVGTESPTGTGSEAALGVQPALIPTPADADALPINRIRVLVARVSDGVLVSQSAADVTATDPSWTVDVTVPEPYSTSTVYVFAWLLNVAGDDTESVQFSGRSDAIELVPGEELSPDIPIVRGPVANLFTTAISITSPPATLAQGASVTLAADVTSDGADDPIVYWTSLDPTVVSMTGAVATGTAEGTTQIVASAGMFADTATVQVLPALTVTTTALPAATQGTPYSQTVSATGGDGTYTWSLSGGNLPAGLALDPSSGVISGTPTMVETASFTVQVASGDGQTATRPLSIDVTVPAGGGLVRWANAVDGDWSVAANWSPARVPLPADSVVIDAAGSYTVALARAATVQTLTLDGASGTQTLSVNGGALTVSGDGLVGSNGVLEIVDTLAAGGSMTNLGEVVIDGGLLDATLDNRGTLTALQVAMLDATGHTNSGTIDVTGGSLRVFGDLTTSGSVTVDDGRQLDFEFGSVTYEGGTWSGPGEVRLLEGASGLLNADLALGGLSVTLSSSSMTGPGTLIIPSTSFLGVYGSDVGVPITNQGSIRIDFGSLTGDVDHQGTMLLDYTVTLSGTVTTSPGSTITVQGAGGTPTAVSLTGTGGFANNGALVLTSTTAGQDVTLSVPNGPFVNSLTGTITSLTGAGRGTRTLDADLTDRGTLTLDHELVVTGALTVSPDDGVAVSSSNASRLQVAGLDVDGLVLDGVGLTSSGGTVTAFDNVVFQNMDPTSAQLVVTHPGGPSPFTFDGLTFATAPTTGFYVVANDSDVGDGNVLTLELTNSSPADGSTNTATSGGAIVNWGLPPAALVTWTGGGDGTSWSDGANWSGGAVPGSSDSVVVQGATTNDIDLDVDADVRSLTISGAGGSPQFLTAAGANLRASGDILVEAMAAITMGPGDTISGGGQITILDSGLLQLDGSTVDGPLDNRGGIAVHNANTITGPFTTAGTSEIVIEGLDGTAATLAVAVGFTNNGLVDLTDAGTGGEATLAVQGTVVNGATGTLRGSPSSGAYGRFLTAVLDNRGGLDISETFTLDAPSGAHLNSGLIAVAAGTFSLNLNQASFTNQSGGTIRLSGAGDMSVFYPNSGAPAFAQDGLITIGDGCTLLLSGAAGSFDVLGGGLTNLGTLDVAGVPVVNAPGFAQTGSGTLRLNNTTWNGAGTLTNPVGATLDLRSATVNGDVENRGQVLNYGATINGRLTVSSIDAATFTNPSTPYTLTVAGVDVDGAVFDRVPLVVDGNDLVRLDNVTFQNLGSSIQLWVIHPGAGSPFVFDSLTFTEPTSSAYVRADDSVSDTDTLTLVLTNSSPTDGSGATTTTGGAVVSWGAPAPTLNTWTGLGDGSSWSDARNWSGGVPTVYDSVVIGLAATTVTLDQNASVQSLALTADAGGSALYMNGFDLAVSADATVAALNVLRVSGGTLTTGGTVSAPYPGTIILERGTVDGAVDVQGFLNVTDSSVVTGPLATASSSTIGVTGQNGVRGWLTVTGDLTNYGVIQLNGADAEAVLEVTGSLVNDVDANIFVPSGSAGGYLLATLDNRGVLEFDNLLGLIGPSGAAHVNSGLINATGGSLSVSLDGGSLLNQNSGSLSLGGNTNSSVQLSNGASFTNEGSISVASAASLSVSGPGTLDLSAGSWSSGGLVGMTNGVTVIPPPQLLNYGATTTLQIADATWTGGGTLINGQGATLQVGLATLETDLVNGAKMELLSDVDVTGQLFVPDTAAATFSGSGTLTVGGAEIDGATFSGVPVVIDTDSTNIGFSNVTFEAMSSSATQLTVVHPGPAGFDFSGLTFGALVDGDTGLYVSAVDSLLNGSSFDINIASGTANGPSFTATSGPGANDVPTVNWP